MHKIGCVYLFDPFSLLTAAILCLCKPKVLSVARTVSRGSSLGWFVGWIEYLSPTNNAREVLSRGLVSAHTHAVANICTHTKWTFALTPSEHLHTFAHSDGFTLVVMLPTKCNTRVTSAPLSDSAEEEWRCTAVMWMTNDPDGHSLLQLLKAQPWEIPSTKSALLSITKVHQSLWHGCICVFVYLCICVSHLTVLCALVVMLSVVMSFGAFSHSPLLLQHQPLIFWWSGHCDDQGIIKDAAFNGEGAVTIFTF